MPIVNPPMNDEVEFHESLMTGPPEIVRGAYGEVDPMPTHPADVIVVVPVPPTWNLLNTARFKLARFPAKVEVPVPRIWIVEVAMREATVVVPVMTASPETERIVPGVVVPRPRRPLVLFQTKRFEPEREPELLKNETWEERAPVPRPVTPVPVRAQTPMTPKHPPVRLIPPVKEEVAELVFEIEPPEMRRPLEEERPAVAIPPVKVEVPVP